MHINWKKNSFAFIIQCYDVDLYLKFIKMNFYKLWLCLFGVLANAPGFYSVRYMCSLYIRRALHMLLYIQNMMLSGGFALNFNKRTFTNTWLLIFYTEIEL